MKENTCFKGPPKCYDLILTNAKHNFQNAQALFSGFSDFHKMTLTVMKTTFIKADPIKINYRDFKNYNPIDFTYELKNLVAMKNQTLYIINFNISYAKCLINMLV